MHLGRSFLTHLHDVGVDDAGAGQQNVRHLLHCEDLRQARPARKEEKKQWRAQCHMNELLVSIFTYTRGVLMDKNSSTKKPTKQHSCSGGMFLSM